MAASNKSVTEDMISTIVNDIRLVKKKKPDKKFIVREAAKHGLSKTCTTSMLGQMVSNGKLYSKGGSYYVVNAPGENAHQSDNDEEETELTSIKTSPKSPKGKQNPSSTPLRHFEPSVAELPHASYTALPDFGIYQSFSQLANCVAELHRIIFKEREINKKLQEENLSFRRKLSLVGGSIQTTEVTQIRTKETEQKDDNTNNNDNNATKGLPIIYESIVNTKNETLERATRKKKSKKKKRKTKGFPDDKGQPCNSKENDAASDPSEDSKVQPGNSRESGEQEERIVTDNEDGNANNAKENKTVPKEKDTKHDTEKEATKDAKQKHTTVIIGDSMIKNVKPWELKHRCEKNERIYVKSFSGANVDQMKHYVKPTIEDKPDAIILHVGTNELRSKKRNEVQIAEEIIGLAKSIEQEKISITVSGLIARSDPFEERRRRVNLILADMCFESKLPYIDHPNIDSTIHLNRSKLHLNSHGDKILTENLFKASRL